ncbi:MAG: DUF5010 domain-containing protein [Planctomycetota bacterium]
MRGDGHTTPTPRRRLAGRLGRLASGAAVAIALAASPLHAGLFQHLDASVPDSFVNVGGVNTWLDQSGAGRHAVDTSAGTGSVTFSSNASVFPTGYGSVRFDGTNLANFGRMDLLSAAETDAVLDQSGPGAAGYSVFVVARGDAPPPVGSWNDLIGNTTDVGDGAFLMRYNATNGRFQAAVGGLTVQNNFAGEDNYGSGQPTVYAFNYDPSKPASEITLASSLNDYSQVFNLSDSVTDRDFSNNDPLTLGKAFDTITRLFNGNVGEVKVYDAALSSAAFQAELDALTTKWTASPDGRLDLIIDRGTGLAALFSPGGENIPLAGLRLTSDSGSLDPTDWLSITENYDADSGSSSVDGDDSWLELKRTGSELSEATLGTSVVTPGQAVNLGRVFRLDGAHDIAADYADPETLTTRDVLVRYVGAPPLGLLPGDYNADGSVDSADFTVWRDAFDGGGGLFNEVVSQGRATIEDYEVWAANFGATSGSSAAGVPEPAAAGLAGLAVAMAALLGGRSGKPHGVRRLLVCIALGVSVLNASVAGASETTVGAYYYPWWDTHDWNETLRAQLLPQDHRPLAGYTNSSNADLIADHINQSHRGNISMWSHSWWGPGSIEDRVLEGHILPHPRSGELTHSVLYEPTGRLGDLSNPDFSNLTPDFEYLAEHVFPDPNYYRIDGRPVLFIWISRAYFNTPVGEQALADARLAVQQRYGYDPYIVGDEVTPNFNATRAAQFDAVTRYGIYGLAGLNREGVNPSDIDQAARAFSDAAATGAKVIPGVVPGYNDKAVRDGNPVAQRYYEGQTVADAGSVFRDLLQYAAVPNTDPSVNNLVMVTSFNEWYEDTQIEATVPAAASSVDASPSGTAFTDGYAYEGYGFKYLDILQKETTSGPTLIDGDADFDGVLDIPDDVAAFVAAWGREHRVDGRVVGGIQSRSTLPDFNYDGVVDFEDWFYMRAAHPAAASINLQRLLAVPEPAGASLVGLSLSATLTRNRGFRRNA